MWNGILRSELALGFWQAGMAALFALAIALAARSRGIRLTGETAVALGRGIVQIVAVGFILAVLLRGPRWTSPFVLAAMTLAAGRIASRRARRFPGAFRISLYAIGLGAGSAIALMTALGVIKTSVSALIPVGSMVLANAMNANALALERFRSDVEAHAGEVESALALGAAPAVSVARYVQSALSASLIPSINNLRSLGIVWIPGLMAGMVLSGASPLYASVYQFAVIAMILASSGLTCLISTYLMSGRAFSAAGQLVLRPGAGE
ncbi:MAG: ABC transporter permease [Acidobacteria bacterium]|nr:ABC transporter permease [Acidobacteriota bacterium]